MTPIGSPIVRQVYTNTGRALLELRQQAATVRPTSERYEQAHRIMTEQPRVCMCRDSITLVWD